MCGESSSIRQFSGHRASPRSPSAQSPEVSAKSGHRDEGRLSSSSAGLLWLRSSRLQLGRIPSRAVSESNLDRTRSLVTMALGSVDGRPVSPTLYDGNSLASRPGRQVSDLGTPSQIDGDADSARGFLALAEAWPHLPDHLCAAILLMLQPWVRSGLDVPQGDAADPSTAESRSSASKVDPNDSPNRTSKKCANDRPQ